VTVESDSPFFAEFLDDYFAECEEHLTAAQSHLLELERFIDQPEVDRSILDELFRRFHTIKGLSGMVGFSEVEQLAHQMESYLRELRQGGRTLTSQGMDALVTGAKMLDQALAARRAQQPPPDITPVVEQLKALVSGGKAPQPDSALPPFAMDEAARARLEAARRAGIPIWRFEFTPAPELAERGIDVNYIRTRLQEIGEVIHVVPQIVDQGRVTFEFLVATRADEDTFASWQMDGLTWSLYEDPQESEIAPQSPPTAPEMASRSNGDGARPASPSLIASNLVRVDLTRLDELMRIVGELVISRARLEDTLHEVRSDLTTAHWRQLQEVNLILERQLRELRESIMRARMVPIGEVFERMRFAVRDLAREYHKEVILELSGQETEIDKLLVDRLMDPLLHLVRNAVSHGLESPEERAARGKPPQGRLALRASTVGDTVVIEVEDDGRGINVEQVARRGRELGLVVDNEPLDPAQLLEVLCAPGFSTREQADRASGRGVGMSAVKETIQELGGTLKLDTQPGHGTRFTIRLPLTLAITDALILAVGEHTFAIPLTMVREVIEVEPERVTTLENRSVISHRGGVLPLIYLSQVFGLTEHPGRAHHVLVLDNETAPVGLVVDRVVGLREIVVRTLNDPLVRIPGIAGATDLGDGRVVLILDAIALTRMQREGEANHVG